METNMHVKEKSCQKLSYIKGHSITASRWMPGKGEKPPIYTLWIGYIVQANGKCKAVEGRLEMKASLQAHFASQTSKELFKESETCFYSVALVHCTAENVFTD